MIRRLCVLAVGAVLSGFAFLLLTGRYSNDGPVLLSLGRDHGLHAGDLFVIAGWAVAMAALVVLATRPRAARPFGSRFLIRDVQPGGDPR